MSSQLRKLAAVAVCLWIHVDAAHAQVAARYPGVEWDRVEPAQSGWSAPQLAQAENWSRDIGSAAVVVVQHGVVVASWGETPQNIALASVRKSLASALIGIAVADHQIDLNATVGQLGIDDSAPSLTDQEKQATVQELLEARSGVYHRANYENEWMARVRPPRGSHPAGTYWYYNNWDFNVLGAIYEHATGTPIFEAFARQIATPVGMQDFDPGKCRYSGGSDSIYPAYVFYASARDLARFGLLYLRHGRWRDRQIIPAQWVDDSTKAYSTTHIGSGYGFLWWTSLPGQPLAAAHLPAGSFFAWGDGGEHIFVVPSADLVIVHLAHMRLVGSRMVGVGLPQMADLISLILAAAGS